MLTTTQQTLCLFTISYVICILKIFDQDFTANIEESDSVLKDIIQHDQNKSLEISLQSFFSSIFHMNINRLFISNQRLFEMIIYDYLLRYYKMKVFIK